MANAVIEEKEIYGDDLVRLLDEQKFQPAVIDYTDETVWPKFLNYSRDEHERDRDKKGKGDGGAPVELNA